MEKVLNFKGKKTFQWDQEEKSAYQNEKKFKLSQVLSPLTLNMTLKYVFIVCEKILDLEIFIAKEVSSILKGDRKRIFYMQVYILSHNNCLKSKKLIKIQNTEETTISNNYGN